MFTSRKRFHILGVMLVVASIWLLLTHARTEQARSKRRADSLQDAEICRRHGLPAWDATHRKVFDLLLFHTELDWLEIRLHTLASQVDYFVILESTTTFTGLPKELYFEKHWERFELFRNQIIHHVVREEAVHHTAASTWRHEKSLRDATVNVVFPLLEGTSRSAREGDVIMVSDVDEIPRPEAVRLLRRCRHPQRVTLRSEFYYYAFQWRHRGVQWHHPQATTFRSNTTIPPHALRHGEDFDNQQPEDAAKIDIWNAAWHCSSCFQTVAEVQDKIRSFSHTEFNLPSNNAPRTIVHRFRNGLDLFARPGEFYEEVFTSDIPAYITEQHQLHGRFGYLLNRTAEDAGFSDVQAMLHNDEEARL